jgi:hypothetical protein
MSNKKIDNWADNLPFLLMPEKGEAVNIRILTAPKQYNRFGIDNEENIIVSKCERLLNNIYGSIGSIASAPEQLVLFSTLYKEMLAELKKYNIAVDKDLNCIVGRVWTIKCISWLNGPKELWKINEFTKRPIAPKTYSITLRRDL